MVTHLKRQTSYMMLPLRLLRCCVFILSSNQMSEASLKQNLLDQRVDPVEEQMTHVQLDLIKRLDQNRITDRTKYNLEQIVRSGLYTGFYVPRVPKQVKAKQVVVPSNNVRVGETLYRRFSFDRIRNLPKTQPPVLTFAAYKERVLSKSYLHKHGVSIRDQMALNEV